MVEQITSFSGEYRFLSNFYPAKTMYFGTIYETSEHAYQAAKTVDNNSRFMIYNAVSPGVAKQIGQHVSLRPMWEEIKVGIMHQIVLDKFDRNQNLREKLLSTGNAFLEEGNTWGDKFWGVCRGEGLNYLGRILMAVRNEI